MLFNGCESSSLSGATKRKIKIHKLKKINIRHSYGYIEGTTKLVNSTSTVTEFYNYLKQQWEIKEGEVVPFKFPVITSDEILKMKIFKIK